MAKVMIIVPSMKKVAPITVIFNLCKFIDRSKVKVYLFSLDSRTDETTYFKEFKEHCENVFFARKGFNVIRDIISTFRENQINILHANGFRPNVLVFLSKLLVGGQIKTVSTVHSIEKVDFVLSRGKLKGTLGYLVNNFIYNHIDVICTVSEGVRNYINNVLSGERAQVVYNGIDLEKFDVETNKELKTGKFKIGAVGKLIPIKSFNHLVEAASLVVHKYGYSDVEFRVAGDGPERQRLQEKIKECNLEDKFFMLGYVDPIQDFYKQIDLLVVTSLAEGMPLVTIESQASGVPIVGVDTGGINEIVIDGSSGFLFNYGDIETLALRIIEVMNGLLTKMSENSKYNSKRFDARIMASDYQQIYRELVNG